MGASGDATGFASLKLIPEGTVKPSNQSKRQLILDVIIEEDEEENEI